MRERKREQDVAQQTAELARSCCKSPSLSPLLLVSDTSSHTHTLAAYIASSLAHTDRHACMHARRQGGCREGERCDRMISSGRRSAPATSQTARPQTRDSPSPDAPAALSLHLPLAARVSLNRLLQTSRGGCDRARAGEREQSTTARDSDVRMDRGRKRGRERESGEEREEATRMARRQAQQEGEERRQSTLDVHA